MKKNNFGFSMVELIIVIAIMAILAAALAPVLIKYINKARISSDIDAGKAIATAIMTVIADGGDFDDHAVSYDTPHEVNDMKDDTFKKEVFRVAGIQSATITGKSKKDALGAAINDQIFYYTLDVNKNFVAVYYGGTDADHQIYPAMGKCLSGKQ
ncbi:MAG: prepilin-type N-terminal cleavage/methylation domain-containing protein [Lachnospiraceae bacterium]